jgi:glycogen(starch) synthase
MKVLMLGWELPPHNSGGLGVASYNICRSLSRRNVDIEFILPYQSSSNFDFMKVIAATPQSSVTIFKSGIAYDSFKYTNQNNEEIWLDIFDQQQLYEFAVAKIVEDRDYDIVHAHDWLTFRAALRVREKKKIPIILHVHSIESDRAGGNQNNPLIYEIESLAFRLADSIIAVSGYTKNKIVREYGIPEDNIQVIHNSINHDDFNYYEDDNDYRYIMQLKTQGYKIVTNIGRMTIQKALHNLLYTAKGVIDLNPKTFFLIVGDGEQYYELIELAASLGIGDKVLFVGFQRGKKLRDAYRLGDLFVMPSYSEPFGLTALESIGYGVPALVSKQSGVSEVMNNLLKVDFWDINEMINQISATIRYQVLRDELISNALIEFGHLSWDETAEKIENLYRYQVSRSEVNL